MQHKEIVTILFGGEAGDGIKEAGINLGRILNQYGQNIFVSFDYQSLIKGGHNFSRLSFSADKVRGDYKALDILVALNNETISLHKSELKNGGLLISDNNLPMQSLIKEMKAPMIARTSVALGALCFYFGLDLDILKKIFKEIFKDKAEINIKLAEKGYAVFREKKIDKKNNFLQKNNNKQLIDGNEALARGLIHAGLKNYFAYPMTPASTVLHYLASKQKDCGLQVIQPENEIAAAGMTLGAATTGQKSATGSSGGGFALMEEIISLSGIAEIPVLFVESQRTGPSTGVPTYTTQGDLSFVRGAGHGEFPKIVLAPGDPEEAYQLGGLGLNLAWKYQVPVILLLDRNLSENITTSDLSKIKIKNEKGKIFDGKSSEYKRFKLTADNISPMTFYGQIDSSVKLTSYEHDEQGLATEDASMIKKMQEKRYNKIKKISADLTKKAGYKVYGDLKSSRVLVGWGSTKGAILEALPYLKKSFKFIQILSLEPLADKKLFENLKKASQIIDIENNIGASLASLLREKTGIEIDKKILRYDGRVFEPLELAQAINKML
jgi:2-oxoglutarate ferredoxin oxidoreductase subunit alpha